MTTTHDDEQSRIVTTGEFPKCECCGRTFIGRNEVCIGCKKYVKARELAARESADTWWITTGMKQNGKKLLGPFATRDLALSVRTYMEIAEAPATYWVEDLKSQQQENENNG